MTLLPQRALKINVEEIRQKLSVLDLDELKLQSVGCLSLFDFDISLTTVAAILTLAETL
ncbi:MAG: hypothetical protein J6X42_05720 [Alphaproteobacteria bacterium]|nr:hypothetical protein [Alphaproteobacteria bacterium]